MKSRIVVLTAKSRVSGVVLAGPLAPLCDDYGRELSARGYTPRSVVPQLRQAVRLSRWLQGRGLTAAQVDERRVEEFLAVQRAEGRHRSGWSRSGLLCLLEVLREQGVAGVSVPAPAASDTEVLLGSFERYLLEERGLATGTVCGYVAHARRFLDELAASAVTAAEVTAVGDGSGVHGVGGHHDILGRDRPDRHHP